MDCFNALPMQGWFCLYYCMCGAACVYSNMLICRRCAPPPCAAVLIFGCLMTEDDALDCCDAAGVPVSPSMVGPHPLELVTQLQVFFKQHRYPEHKAFVL